MKNNESSNGMNNEKNAAGAQGEGNTSGTGAAPKKKKFTAVFRPQNAQQISVKPRPQRQKPAPAPAPAAKSEPAAAKVQETAAAQQETAARRPETQAGQQKAAPRPAAASAGSAAPAAETEARRTAEKVPENPAQRAERPAVSAGAAREVSVRKETAPEKAAASAAVSGETAAPAPKTREPEPVQQEKAAQQEKPVQQKSDAAGAVRADQSAQGAPAQRTVRKISGQETDSAGSQRNAETRQRTGGTRPAQAGRPSGGRSFERSSFQGDRGGGYQGNRGSYQGSGSGYQGNRSSYQGTRGTDRPGFRGPRTGTGYQGNRPGAGSGSGYQGNRGSYQQGARPQGSRPGFGNRPGSFGGGAPHGNRGSFGGGESDSALVRKTVSSRPNKNNFKDRNDKRHRTEDGFKTNAKSGKVNRHPFIMPEKQKEAKVEDDIREIIIPETITISDLAKKMRRNSSELIKKLFAKGEMYTINSEIPFEKAEELALDYDILCTKEKKEDVIGELLHEDEENEADMVPRPPVVCVMGHVDHGKTSLLDAIRKTNVTSREAGGITQHIGAYQVRVKDRLITFLDTPGHEAFTAMRMRGAQATDIAILVVAADDGVMPQTVEAINHAKAANVDIIVAINKIDKPAANIDRVKQELMQYGLVSEEWGGNTICCPISAKTHEGIDELLENVLLVADVKELKANPNRNARGLVIEARLDKGKGPVANILVQKGTLHVGDYIATGECYGKIRAMTNDKGMRVKDAKPSTPVSVQGLNAVPNAGDVFVALDSDKEAKDFAETFIREGKSKLIEETKAKLSLDDLFGQIKAGEIKELPIIVKADVQGSVEALQQSLTKLSNDEVKVKVIHGAVGAISESDVDLASASNAIIIGFNVRPDATAKSTADREHVDIRLYKVIYQAIDDIEGAMNGMLAPVYEERVIGHAEVRQIFKASGIGTIAGSYVLDGKIQRGCKVRVSRGGKQLFEGNLASLKRFKDDVKEVLKDYECGIVVEGFNDIMEGDQVEAYIMAEVPREQKQ